jgi:amidase
LEREISKGEDPGPLAGVPVGIKDLHHAKGIRTTMGSHAYKDFVPDEDDVAVERLKRAGAVVLGKTNVPEFAAGSHTFNALFGVTHNPYRHGLSAGGSSGGAAAALAAGFVPVAEGSDFGGSLRNPAGFCNVVGLRPTPGRVPTWPAAMGWSQLSVDGPMGRTVADVALVLSAIAGPDRRVPISLDDPGAPFAAPLPERLDGLRVAWAPDLGGRVPVDPAITAVLSRSVAVFEELGATVEPDCPDLSGADDVFGTLRAWLFDATFSDLAQKHPDGLKESIRWNAALGAELTGTDVARAEMAHTALYERVVGFFDRYDVLLAPTTQVLPFPVEQEYPTEIDGEPLTDYLAWMRSCTLITPTGCPALSVPGGFTPDGLPVGLQVVAPPRADRRLLEVGHAFEQTTPFGERRPPL